MALDERDPQTTEAQDGEAAPRRRRARERYERRRQRGEGAKPAQAVGQVGGAALTGIANRLKVFLPTDSETGERAADRVAEKDEAMPTLSSRPASAAPAQSVPTQGIPSVPAAGSSDDEIDFLTLVPPRYDARPAETSAQRRARERSRPSQQATPRGRRVQQVAPAGGFSLSDLRRVDLSGARTIIYIAAAATIVLGILIGSAVLKEEPLDSNPHAIWLGEEWTHRQQPPEQMARLVGRLREHRIGTVYARISWLKDDLTWAGDPLSDNDFNAVRPTVEGFAADFRTMYPTAQLYGWIDFPVDRGPLGYRLDDPTAQAIVADFTRLIVDELGYDGVFLNVAPVWERNADDFINLLQQVNLTMGELGPLAIAVPPDWSPSVEDVPRSPLIAPGTEWSARLKQRVALLSDQVALTPYGSGLTDRADYAEWVAYQVAAYIDALSAVNTSTRIVVGIPSYDNEPPTRNAAVENIPAALDGVRQALGQAGRAGTRVQGVALFAEWTMDDAEWRLFRQLWLE